MPARRRSPEEIVSPGGQVASAMVACARLGLRAKYIGAMGDDERGRIQMESLRGTGIDLDHVQLRRSCPNQSAYIIVDRIHRRAHRLLAPRRLSAHRPGTDRARADRLRAPAAHRRARYAPPWRTPPRIARERRHPRHGGRRHHLHGFDQRAAERRLPDRQLRISRPTGPANSDPFRALETLQDEYGMNVAAMTLGAHGALARDEAADSFIRPLSW